MKAPGTPAQVLASRRLLVCVGCGGVGKTTVAASVALQAARAGRRALVVTIDPARRLADAIGATALGNAPVALPRDALARVGVPEGGALFAMMLDMKRTFDDLVLRFAGSPELRERILANRIYQNVSDALSGSIEYAAMEKVYELHETGAFDVIVLDTPPSQHALDFLEAPERLIEFLDSRLVQLLLHPAFAAGRLGFRIFQRSAQRVLKLIERVSGIGFLEDVSEFLLAFEGMSEGFRERARHVRGLLLGPESAFLLVAGPGRESVAHAEQFLDRLASFRVPLSGVVVNRARVWPGNGEPPERVPLAGQEDEALRALAAVLAPLLGEGVPAEPAALAALRAVESYASLVRRDGTTTAILRERARRARCFWRRIPEFAEDVHDLEGLARIADWLFTESAGDEA